MNTMRGKLSGLGRIAVPLAVVAAFGLVTEVHASCVSADWSNPGAKATSSTTVYHPGHSLARLLRWTSDSDERPAIVGLWKFEMLSKSTPKNTNPMPDGTLIDFGTAAWHADGTEFQTSGMRNPSDGDVCQGVWEQVDDSTFVLNHIALAWTDGTYTGPANIRARVTVDGTGNRYSGHFVTVVHLATATPGHEFDEATVLATITGTFTATRVTVR
jgi:hypothetical protein